MSFRLLDFNIYDETDETGQNIFNIQIFGMNEIGETYSVILEKFNPFFFVKIGDWWTRTHYRLFIQYIKDKIGDGLVRSEVIHRKKFYGFDAGKKYKFVKLEFQSMKDLRSIKNLWYESIPDENSPWGKRRRLRKDGFKFKGTALRIYESNIPPLLRYFHIYNISPSGWVRIDDNVEALRDNSTYCDYEYRITCDQLHPIVNKEEIVPLKICSFDIEASSSHGDFPLAKKTYEKLAMDTMNFWDEYDIEDSEETLRNIILQAFGLGDECDEIKEMIHYVYPKKTITEEMLEKCFKKLFKKTVRSSNTFESTIECKLIHILDNSEMDRSDKLEKMDNVLTGIFPPLKGDQVTFIGSSFLKMGEMEPYLNHCIALGECDKVDGCTIECYDTEKEVLLAWTRLIQRENPDIVAGYNIFGFDFKFMLERCEELGCKYDFLKLSRNRDEKCNEKFSSLKIASGVHELRYIEMKGRVPFDLYNYFRREVNLSSYKLDNVASHFIGDNVISYNICDHGTCIYTKNILGLKNENYVRFEIMGNSLELYEGGKKFKVLSVDDTSFTIDGVIDSKRKMRWSLVKDDITPQDIFRLSNGSTEDKALVAKYCVRDCELPLKLMIKNDILIGFFEVSNICSVPVSFIVLRGQGIKLLSFVGKKCREKETLLPDINKGGSNEGYEGAICFTPKADLYLDEPIAVVDYGSLYPSSMISENLSQDSKVWTKEYNLEGTLIKKTGDDQYDHLEGYQYVDVTYDTYKWIRKREGGREIKTKVGKKVCRFAQYPNDQKAIMPSILVELLAARKATRKLIKYKTVTSKDGNKYEGLLVTMDEGVKITTRGGDVYEIKDVEKIEDTYDEFMKNVFDKRQLGYKITANSLYGQCGAKTSAFYDKDIAAATTATGRKLLLYAKRVIEEVYKNRVCQTSFGKVKTNPDCIYGDTDSCFFTLKLEDMEGNKIKGRRALEITIELAQEMGALATKMLKAPHDLEYEKTFMPFCLISKKRYVGMLYETDVNKCKRKSMGIVLKRRDNAQIVKKVVGGVIDIIMKEMDIEKAIEFSKNCMEELLKGKYGLEDLTVTKSLRGFYKHPGQIAHKVLADRMGKRDPGNKPSTGSRIPFVYIKTKGNVKLQGDRIEHPDYVKKHKLEVDYNHYITNQIMKPLQQIFALPYILYNISAFKRKKGQFLNGLKYLKQTLDDEKYIKKEKDLRNKEVQDLIFSEILRNALNKKNGNNMITTYFC